MSSSLALAGDWEFPKDGKAQWTQAGGKPSDIVNIYVHGDQETLVKALVSQGWVQAKKKTVGNSAIYALIAPLRAFTLNLLPGKKISKSMPVNTQRFNDRPQDLAFEDGNHFLGGRDHFRVFKTGQTDANNRNVFAIAATKDVRVGMHGLHLNHKINPNADVERDVVLKALKTAGVVKTLQELPLDPGSVNPVNKLTSEDHFVADVVLKSPDEMASAPMEMRSPAAPTGMAQ